MKQTPLRPGAPLERRTELRRRTSLNRTGRRGVHPISPASDAQREAIAGMPCVGCGREQSEWLAIDPAHVWPRARGGCDSRFCALGLCRAGDGSGCHREFDEGRLDLLSILTADWDRWRHHVQHALRHATLVQVTERLAGAKILGWAREG